MQRTLRSKKLRALLYYTQNGLCAICERPLPDDWHADHIVPWVKSQRTNVFEMQGLCPECNLKKGSKMPSVNFDRSQARPGQLQSIDKIIDGIRSGVDFIPCVLPTGYGKSDVIRLSSIIAHRLGLISVAIIASPNTILRDQIISEQKFGQMLDRYGIKDRSDIRYGPLDKVRYGMPFNGDIILSSTIQLLTKSHQLELLKSWASSILHTSGRPPLLHIDEAHTSSEQNTWGSLVIEWRRAGGIVALHTATPERHDNIQIPGIPLKTVDIEPVQTYSVKPGSKPETIKVSIYEAMKQQVMLDLDYVEKHGVFVPFRTAWDENVICHINRVPFDIELNRVNVDASDEGATMLSELSEGKTRQILGVIVRDREVILSGAQLMVEEIGLRKLHHPACAAIIFCANDSDSKEANAHAKEIERIIRQINPSLQVVIATAATGLDETDEEITGKKTIEAFAGSKGAPGRGDVLIVKQMASIGLDIERIKVVLDLSPTRTAASFIQRLNRATRPFEGIYTCSYVTPDDCLARALFKRFVEDENGNSPRLGEKELVAEIEKLKGESKPQDVLVVGGTEMGGLGDTKGQYEDGSLYDPALRFLTRLPVLADKYTHNDIIGAIKHAGLEPSSKNLGSAQNTSLLVEAIRRDCNDLARKITNKITAYDPSNPDLWRSTQKNIWNRAKDRAGIPLKTRLDDIRDLSLLRKVKTILTAMKQEVGDA